MIGSTAIPIGIPGLELAPGDHLCAFYRGPAERDEILALLVRSGMDAGHKCICIMDRETEATLRNALTGDVDVENCVACGQLELLPVEKSYLRGGLVHGRGDARILARPSRRRARHRTVRVRASAR